MWLCQSVHGACRRIPCQSSACFPPPPPTNRLRRRVSFRLFSTNTRQLSSFSFFLSPASTRPTLSLSLSPSLSRRSVSSHADRLFEVAPASSPLPFVIVGFGGLDGVMRDTAERLGFLWITTTATAAGHSADTVVSSRQQSRSSL